MKYSEFLQLSEVLENNNTSVVKEFGLKEYIYPVNEAETDLDTEKTTVAGRAVSKWRRVKNQLNKQAKKIQAGLTEKIINKNLPTILETERKTTEALKDAQKNGAEAIKNIMRRRISETKDLQTKQLRVIYDTLGKYVEQNGEPLYKKIETSKVKDKNKLTLKNYWLLLLSQIKLNGYAAINRAIKEDAQKTLGDNEKILNFYNKYNVVGAENNKQYQEAKVVVDEKTKVVKDSEAAMKTEKTDNLQVGAKLNLKDEKTGKLYPVEIEKLEDNKVTYKTEDGKSWSVSEERFKQLLSEKTTKEKSEAEREVNL